MELKGLKAWIIYIALDFQYIWSNLRQDDAKYGRKMLDKYESLLRQHDLRPTRQRLLISEILFGCDHRHVTAEQLRSEVADRGGNMSLATIYNTLNQFSDVGLLREIKLEENVTYYDTNNDHHHHFYDPKQSKLIDIPSEQISLDKLPDVPDGQTIDRVDVIIRLS